MLHHAKKNPALGRVSSTAQKPAGLLVMMMMMVVMTTSRRMCRNNRTGKHNETKQCEHYLAKLHGLSLIPGRPVDPPPA